MDDEDVWQMLVEVCTGLGIATKPGTVASLPSLQ